jgi:Peptidase A4 family
VFQAGTESDAYCANGARYQYYSLWYEWYPNSATRITNLAVSPGDLIEAYIWYTTSAPFGNVYLVDLTTEQATYVGFGPPAWNDLFAYSSKSGLYYIPTYVLSGTAYSIAMTAGGVTISSCSYSGPIAMWCIPSGPAL